MESSSGCEPTGIPTFKAPNTSILEVLGALRLELPKQVGGGAQCPQPAAS